MWIPVRRTWRLNERHYGALEGCNKSETAARVGNEQVKIWRRSYDVKPPAITADDIDHLGHDPRYAHLKLEELPTAESLSDTCQRMLPYWKRR